MAAPAPPRDERDWLTTREIAEEVDASYRQVTYWVNRGYVEPSVKTAKGSGTLHRWRPEDAQDIQRIYEIITAPRKLSAS